MEAKCIFEVLHDEIFQEKSRILRPRKKNFKKIPYPEFRKIFTLLDDLFFFFG